AYPAKALEILYDLFNNSLFTFACRLTHDEHAARDIVHDTFLHLYENSRKLSTPHESPIERYLIRVVRFKSISYYRRSRHLSLDKLLFLDGTLPFRRNAEDVDTIENEISQQVWEVVRSFPRREQQCLLMRFNEGMSADQIAVRLEVSRKAVERSITSGKKRLRKWARSNF
ncbi:MAG TPA: sigma-70 family RNA polymerase sigma factor, partial [Ohtaekwangia sp.]|nr:sigma-70 family RNA polymerase sigma factor [Ohtaekwangia sp.]